MYLYLLDPLLKQIICDKYYLSEYYSIIPGPELQPKMDCLCINILVNVVYLHYNTSFVCKIEELEISPREMIIFFFLFKYFIFIRVSYEFVPYSLYTMNNRMDVLFSLFRALLGK